MYTDRFLFCEKDTKIWDLDLVEPFLLLQIQLESIQIILNWYHPWFLPKITRHLLLVWEIRQRWKKMEKVKAPFFFTFYLWWHSWQLNKRNIILSIGTRIFSNPTISINFHFSLSLICIPILPIPVWILFPFYSSI